MALRAGFEIICKLMCERRAASALCVEGTAQTACAHVRQTNGIDATISERVRFVMRRGEVHKLDDNRQAFPQ
jgi:hypothetical protein